MDPVDDILTTMNIEESRYVRVDARAPWGISFRPRHLARLVLIASGSCWLTADSLGDPQLLTAGDCFLVQAAAEFTLEDEQGRDVVDCETVFEHAVGTVAKFGGCGELTEVASGRFSFDVTAAEPLFALLPPLFRLNLEGPSGQLLRATFDLIARESAEGGAGSDLVTSRLADVLFVQALRTCCGAVGAAGIGWLSALQDPRLAAAMRALHGDLARPWTVDGLAREAGMSRSAFAAAFRARAGDTPLGYLTSWRMYRAKSLLRATPLSVQEIAVRVGYDTGTALSRAFVRTEGVAPGAWRQQARRAARQQAVGA
jgi:AraC-like DNA-binding protein